jgi:hypothetical protein
MDMLVVKVLGIVFLSLVFVVTVLLMPRIFGVNTPSARVDTHAAAPPPTIVAAPPVAVPQPAERLAKR